MLPLLANAAAATPPGALIRNQAFVTFEPASDSQTTVFSNEVELRTAVVRSPSSITFVRPVGTGSAEPIGASSCFDGTAFTAQATTPPGDSPIAETARFNIGELLLLRLQDDDQNTRFDVIDTADVELRAETGDLERVRLVETGPDTGTFTGYLASGPGPASATDCLLQGTSETSVVAHYADPQDGDDRAQASALFDPSGLAFDSRSGAPLDGVEVRLVDENGAPAVVYGNDGSSVFPSAIVTGERVFDSGGTEYDLSGGRFRFPTLPAGSYRIVVMPPDGYTAPSTAAPASLASLPQAPFDLVPASFGAAFDHDGSGPFAFDYPLDPRSVELFVQKRAQSQVAAPGDFVRFDVTVRNDSIVAATNAFVVDRLPPGTRYVDDSATVDDGPLPIPLATGDELRFDLPDLAPASSTTLSYVLEIVSGADGDTLRNTALARADGGLVSNESTAILRLREDLFRSRGHLLGRVTESSCAMVAGDTGVGGVRIYLEDGRYSVTDETGRFHFEGVEPGTHVAQLDAATVPDHFEVIGCNDDPRYAGRPDSQLVDLTAGALRRIDFHLSPKLAPEGRIDLALSMREAATDHVAYRLDLDGTGEVPVDELRASVLLPDGVTFVSGSARMEDGAPGDPRQSGQALIFELPDQVGDWQQRISFLADIDPTTSGELVTRAVARFVGADGAPHTTPVAETLLRREAATLENAGYVLGLSFEVLSDELSPADRAELDELIAAWRGVTDIRINAIGHSDSTRIAPRSRHLFADNYALSRARARSAARYVADALGVKDADMLIEGRGPDDPVADNSSSEGRLKNRRVELVLAGRRPGRQSVVQMERESSGVLVTDTRGSVPGAEARKRQRRADDEREAHLTPPVQTNVTIEALQPGVGWVLPREDYRPPIPSLKVSVLHAPRQTIVLSVNGIGVDPANFTGSEVDRDRGVAVSNWAGVELVEGSNQLVADIVAADGTVTDRLRRRVHYAGPAVRAELLADASRLVADGRERPLVAVRMIDRFGEPARHSAVGTYDVDAPYRSWWQVENDRENKLVHLGNREPLYTVGDNGIAFIELEPTTESGAVTLRFRFANDHEQALEAWLEPAARDWILVGFGEGTVGYQTLSAASESSSVQDHGYYENGRLAFFAKGRVRGDYLLTLAYDSARERGDEFRQAVDPDAWYSLYADNTEQRFEAQSQRKLYVKLERRQFAALFGDFATGLSTTELSRYERRLNGFRSEYAGEHIGYRVFASDTAQGLVRDEIQGDGTSGLYRLSVRPIIAQSENVRIEVRDRFDQAQVVSSRVLARFLDYDLDPLTGTLFFKEPVPSRDENFDPVYIVAEYESPTGSGNAMTAGGRIAARTADRRLEVGVTHVSESHAAGGDLLGTDLEWRIADATRLRAEYASTHRNSGAGSASGDAALVSIEHSSRLLDLKASFRQVDQEYGLGHQSRAEQGIRRIALDGHYDLAANVMLRAATARQENLESGAERLVAESAVEYRSERTAASAGVTWAEDRIDGVTFDSTILDTGFSRRILDSAMSLRANGNFALAGTPANSDYLSSYVVGLDYEVVPDANLFIEYENAEGRHIDAQMTRAGVHASPWSRAQFSSSVTNEMSEFGPRLFANLGLMQGFQLTENWVFDVGLDQTSTIKSPDYRNFDDSREPAYGSNREDFVAGWIGSLYQAGDWSMNTRFEHRHADSERRSSILSGWYREPGAGAGLSASLTVFQSERRDGTSSVVSDLRFGWASRRSESPWSLLYRADLQQERVTGADRDDTTWRVVSNLNANRRLSSASQVGLQYAVKYVRSRFGALTVDGVTDLAGIDYRRGIARRWEVAMHGSALHGWRGGTLDYGTGLSVGYNLADDMWVSVGYNVRGFHDPDFTATRYTASGPYLRVTLRAHQAQLKRLARQPSD